jgi:HEAT repeat protein
VLDPNEGQRLFCILSPELHRLLRSDDWELRQSAAIALGNIGAPAARAVPTLVELITADEGWLSLT